VESGLTTYQLSKELDQQRGARRLNVIDEHSRLCPAIRVGRRCNAKDVVAVLARALISLDSGTHVHPQ
jgi:hypothetical protein